MIISANSEPNRKEFDTLLNSTLNKLNINYESINNLNLDNSNNSKTISFNDFKKIIKYT